jgi:hypothetical protein
MRDGDLLTGACWAPVLPAPMRTAAVGVAHDLVARCADSERIHAALAAAREQTDYPMSVHWEPYGVAQGDAGLALLSGCAAAAFPGEGWELTAHEQLASAVRAAERTPWLPANLFGGLAGLLLAASSLSAGGTRYGRVVTALEDALLPATARLVARLRGLGPGMNVGEFDAISGLAGIGVALLGHTDRTPVRRALQQLVGALVDLVDGSADPPRWYTPPEQMGDEVMSRMYPDGNLNCGLAHGIPGPLATMSLARLAGVDVPGLDSAIARVAGWVAGTRLEDAWGVNWPTAVPLGDAPPERGSRAAWCYGAPGVARSLWLAGEALDDVALRALAVAGMEAVYRRPAAERAIDSPTFCHGVAGLLQVTLRFAHDTGLPVFAEAAETLTAQLLDAYDGSRLLGFASLEPGGNRVDQPGLLDGAPGVALVLLAAATDPEPAWDRLFLLS